MISRGVSRGGLGREELEGGVGKVFWLRGRLGSCGSVGKEFWDRKGRWGDGNVKVGDLGCFGMSLGRGGGGVGNWGGVGGVICMLCMGVGKGIWVEVDCCFV